MRHYAAKFVEFFRQASPYIVNHHGGGLYMLLTPPDPCLKGARFQPLRL
jgi:hypothetical protein